MDREGGANVEGAFGVDGAAVGFLNGRFENTVFCILSPDGRERLSAGHRGPHRALGGNLVEAWNRTLRPGKRRCPEKEPGAAS